MHEWSLADAVVRAIINIANKHKARRVVRVKLRLGRLQPIDTEIFLTALKNLSLNTIIEGAKFEIINEDARFKCNNCGKTWSLSDVKEKLDNSIIEMVHFIPEVIHAYLNCPYCGSPNFTIISGRGVTIEEVEVET